MDFLYLIPSTVNNWGKNGYFFLKWESGAISCE